MSQLSPDHPGLSAAVAAFMARCSRDGACLVSNTPRYGEIKIGGDRMSAHRATYIAKVGPIPPGHVIRHKCDRKQCVEPTHLETGTPAQNLNDAYARNRMSKPGVSGAANPSAILDDDTVANLRRSVRSGLSVLTVAKAAELPYPAVLHAVRGKTWRHVAEPPVGPRHKWSRPSPARTPAEVVTEARRLVEAGASLQEVADQVGLNRWSVHNLLKQERRAS